MTCRKRRYTKPTAHQCASRCRKLTKRGFEIFECSECRAWHVREA